MAISTVDLALACQRMEDAVDHFERGGAFYGEARARLALANLLADLDRFERTDREASAAQQALQRFGAAHEAAHASALIARLRGDARPTKATAQSPLSTREREVLRLVAAGLSEKDMAAALTLSEHIIHRHISNILTKLDLPSRAAAVAHAARTGLL